MKYVPSLDKNFKPLIIELNEFKKAVNNSPNKSKLVICLERNDKYNYIYNIDIYKDNTGFDEINYRIVERIIKTLLWLVGGYKVYIFGSKYLFESIAKDYSKNGKREFDAQFMSNVYENKFEIVEVEEKLIPKLKEEAIILNNDFSGSRIGFDAGGSDRKVSALVDGKVLYSEEVVWYPKVTEDPSYHYREIKTAFETAKSYLPLGKIDAIGISSAGIYVNNKVMVASLFLKVPKDLFDIHVKNIYINIAKEVAPNAPILVANDGDVTALAGAMDLNDNQVLGIAMGTSEAAGYVDNKGNFKGWLNELAFVPVDANVNAMIDEWSGDIGCGVKYFSQDGVIKLAEYGGFEFNCELSPAQKLKIIQKLHNEGLETDEGYILAEKIFTSIGIYLGYTIAYYAHFYDIKHILLLGRVVSGRGGDLILEYAKKVIKDEFSELSHINITLPDEQNRRVGQSVAAASLPSLNKK